MRRCVLLLTGVCLLSTSIAAAGQATGAKPPAQAAQPADASKPNADRKEIKLTEKVLKAYVGEYERAPGQILTITLDKGYLWGQPTNQEARQLYPESQTKFFLKDLDIQVAFQKDAKGVVTGLIMTQKGQDRELKKIK